MYQIKNIIVFVLVAIVDFIIAYALTTFFGISNIVLYQSLTATNYIITYEVIIWFLLMLFEVPILNKLEQ